MFLLDRECVGSGGPWILQLRVQTHWEESSEDEGEATGYESLGIFYQMGRSKLI